MELKRWMDLVPCPPPSTNVKIFCDHVTSQKHATSQKQLAGNVVTQLLGHCDYKIAHCLDRRHVTETPDDNKSDSLVVGTVGSGCNDACVAAIVVVFLAVAALFVAAYVFARRRGMTVYDVVDAVRRRQAGNHSDNQTYCVRNDKYDAERNAINAGLEDDVQPPIEHRIENDTIKKDGAEDGNEESVNDVRKYIDSSSTSGSESELEENDSDEKRRDVLCEAYGEEKDVTKATENDNEDQNVEHIQANSNENSCVNIAEGEENLNYNEEDEEDAIGERILDDVKGNTHEKVDAMDETNNVDIVNTIDGNEKRDKME